MSDTPMYCDRCDQTVQKQGPCPKGGNHQLMSISDKGVQGQGPKSGPESEKSSQPAEPADSKPPRKDTTKNAKVASNNDYIRREAIRVLGHDSGDGETVYHCGRGTERYWTRDGLKTLAETVDTVQEVLVNTGSGGVWREAIIHSFGDQPLWKVTLKRNRKVKETYWTAEHRWLVRTRQDPTRADSRIVETADLSPGDRLAWSFPRSAIAQSVPSQFGIAHGIVFGDGTKTTQGTVVRLWGEKDAQLLKYFSESVTYPEKTPNGVLGIRVCNLPASWKEYPDLNESISYLYGWLAGYFAADGCVASGGQATLHSSKREHLEFVQLVAARLGIATYDIQAQSRLGYGAEPSLIYKMQFIGSTLRPEFFLTKEHRERYDDCQERDNVERIGWTVVLVEKTDLIEEVYCPRVEGDNFVLDGWINTKNCPFCGAGQVVGRSDGTVECGFCKTHFTVQVQPEFNPMPQTIDGQPNEMPGMPYGGDGGGQLPPPGEDPNDPMGAQPGSPADEEAAPDPNGNGPEEPPIALSSKRSYYIARDGVLDEDAYVRHLALWYSNNTPATLGEVRGTRRDDDPDDDGSDDYWHDHIEGTQNDCKSCRNAPAGDNGQCRSCNIEDARERDAGI